MAEVIEVRNSATDIDNDTTSVIGLRHLDEIKAYVDGRLGDVSGELSDEMKDYFNDQMEKARDFITNDTANRLDDLKKLLEDAIAAGDLGAIRDIELKIDALNSDFTNKLEAIDAINEQVERLNGKYGDLSNSIFSPGEIDELIKTAFIEGTYISDDRIETPNLFTTKLVALIANFGKIQAANIEGGAISGHTIESNNTIPGQYDENGNPIPLWKIENDGSGWLASKNIEWNEKGDVRFGDDVSLSWKNVDNEGNPIYDALKDLEDAQNDLRQALNDGIGNVVANWMDDDMLSPMEIKELKNELERMTADYNTMEKYLNEIIALYESAANSDIDKDIKIKYRDDLKAGRDSLKQSYDSAKSVCENYINAIKDSVGSIKIDPDKYGDLNKINEYYIKRDEVLKTYYDANSFYVTDNRFGSKLTYIGEDGIYSGKISGDQITGWRLRGLTMESAKTTKLPDYVSWYDYNHNANNGEDAFDGKTGGIGPTWQISKDGDGYLAGGQISWSDQNITLGDKVRINWKQVDDVPEGLEDIKDEVESNYNELLDKLGITREELANLRGSQESIKTNLTVVNNAIKVLTGALDSIQNGAGGDSDNPETVLTAEEIEQIAYALTQNPVYASAIWTAAVTSSTIKAEDIKGSKIAGLTFESYKKKSNSAPYWKLNADGDGYLAGGAITWDEKGRVTLGEGVTINWENINGRPDVDEDGNISLDDEKIKNVVKTTQLGAYTISSGVIAANLVQSNNKTNITLNDGNKYYSVSDNGKYTEETINENNTTISNAPSWQISTNGSGYLANGKIYWNEIGDLTVDGKSVVSGIKGDEEATTELKNIVADSITAKTLNTTGTGNTNNIVIKDNNLYAYNGNSKPSLTVNGSKFTQEYPMTSSESYESKTDSMWPTNTIYKDLKTLSFKSGQKDCWIEVDSQYFRLMLVASINTSKSFSGTVEMDVRLQIYDGSTLVSQGAQSTLSLVVSNNQTTNNGYTINTNGNYVWYSAPVLVKDLKVNVRDIDSDKAYTVKLQITPITSNPISTSVGYLSAWGVSTSTNEINKVTPSKLNISTRSSLDTTNIGDNGFRTAFDSRHFVEFAEYDGKTSMLIYSKGAGIKVTDKDLYLKFGNVWYKCGKSGSNLTLIEQADDQTVFNKYGTLNSNSN